MAILFLVAVELPSPWIKRDAGTTKIPVVSVVSQIKIDYCSSALVQNNVQGGFPFEGVSQMLVWTKAARVKVTASSVLQPVTGWTSEKSSPRTSVVLTDSSSHRLEILRDFDSYLTNCRSFRRGQGGKWRPSVKISSFDLKEVRRHFLRVSFSAMNQRFTHVETVHIWNDVHGHGRV
jgi:hypothetical protein